MKQPNRPCIVGDSLLVAEYAAACAARGLRALVRANAKKSPALPRGVTRIERPPRTCTIALELTTPATDAKRRNLAELDKTCPPRTPILTSSLTVSLAEQSTWVKNPARLVGLGALPTLLKGGLVELARAPHTSESSLADARSFFSALGKETAVTADGVGFVMPRILCMLINESCFALQEGVAEAGNIDTAMKLGTNYPSGPVEWAGRIGWETVYAVVEALHRHYGEERYRPAPFLRQAAALERIPA